MSSCFVKKLLVETDVYVKRLLVTPQLHRNQFLTKLTICIDHLLMKSDPPVAE